MHISIYDNMFLIARITRLNDDSIGDRNVIRANSRTVCDSVRPTLRLNLKTFWIPAPKMSQLFDFNRYFGFTKDNENKENRPQPPTDPFPSTPRTPFAFNLRPQRTFTDRTNQSAQSQSQKASKSVPPVIITSKGDDSKSASTDDTVVLKRKISEELEKIEVYKRLTEMEGNRRMEEIKELKANKLVLSNRLEVLSRENSDLKVKLNVEQSERQDVVIRMNNTREMVYRVKDFLQGIETRMEAFNEVRDIMEALDGQRVQDFKSLTKNFYDLNAQHKRMVTDLQEKIKRSNAELTQKAIELEKIRAAFGQLNCAHQALKNQKEQTDRKIELMKAVIEQNNAKYDTLETAFARLKLENNSLTEKLAEAEAKDLTKSLKIEELSEKNKELETELKKLNEDLEQKKTEFQSMLERKQELEKIIEDKETLVGERDKTIGDLEASVESLRQEVEDLNHLNEENKTLIDSLESKANQTIIEKEMIEEKLTNDIRELKNELETKMKEFQQKIENLEARVKELNDQKELNETTICELLSEKEKTEELLEKEEKNAQNEKQKMSELVEVIKEDYMKRINEKDRLIQDFRRELDKIRHRAGNLNKKYQKMEDRKSLIERHRVESPIRVNMSSVEDNETNGSNKDSKKGLKKEFAEESDFEEKFQPDKKKFKATLGQKTYGKRNLRAQNIEKGLPTPTKTDDLSWLDFCL